MTSQFKVDLDKLKKALAKHNLTLTTLSIDMGYNKGYLSNKLSRGPFAVLRKLEVDYIEKLGIPFDSYKYVEPNKNTEITDKITLSEKDIYILGNTIYKALYAALKQVL